MTTTNLLKDLTEKCRAKYSAHMTSTPRKARETLGDFHKACFELFREIETSTASTPSAEENKRLNAALCETKKQLDIIRDATSRASDAAAKALGQA